MTVWHLSDPHFGHLFVAGTRGYNNTADHDAEIMDAWVSQVKKDDIVWVLGDLSVSNPAAAFKIIKGLPGTKHLIAGNHDQCHPMHRDAYKWQQRYLDGGFASVQAFARRRIEGTEFMLSHFPYSGDHTDEDRCDPYRLRNEGMPLLHGHTHTKGPAVTLAWQSVQISVGWDTNRRLVSLEDIWELYQSAPPSIPSIITLRQSGPPVL